MCGNMRGKSASSVALSGSGLIQKSSESLKIRIFLISGLILSIFDCVHVINSFCELLRQPKPLGTFQVHGVC
jgi:hypothetical protein